MAEVANQNQLHPDTQQHLESIADDYAREMITGRLSRLGEAAVRTSYVDNADELGDEVGGRVSGSEGLGASERVQRHATAIALYTAHAHEILQSGQEPDDEVQEVAIWDKALEIQLAEAVEYRQNGDTENARDVLATYLITTELSRTRLENLGHGSQQEEASHFLNQPIAAGLGEDMLHAARQSFGIVCVEEDFFEGTKVTSVAHVIEAARPQLELALGTTISLDPAETALGDSLAEQAKQERIGRLDLESAAASAKAISLAPNRDQEEKTSEIDHLTHHALKILPDGGWGRKIERGEQLARLSEANSSLLDPGEYQAEFKTLQDTRAVNSDNRNGQDRAYALDKALVELWQSGHSLLAQRFLTAGHEVGSGQDTPRGALDHYLREYPGPKQEIEQEVQRRRQECVAKIATALPHDAEIDNRHSGEYETRHITEDVLSSRNPEIATDLIIKLAEDHSASEIYGLLQRAHGSVEIGEPNLLDILVNSDAPLTNLNEIRDTIGAIEDLQKEGLPRAVLNEPGMFDATDHGAELRARINLLKENVPPEILKSFSYPVARQEFLYKVLKNTDPGFIEGVKALVANSTYQALGNVDNWSVNQIAHNLLKGAIDSESAGEYLEQQQEYLKSVQSMLDHPLFQSLTQRDEPLNRCELEVLHQLSDMKDPYRGIGNYEVISHTDLVDALSNLYDISPGNHALSVYIRDILTNPNIAQDEDRLSNLAEALGAISEHPLMNLLAPGGVLHNRSAIILETILSSEDKYALCEDTYNSFAKAQPLWKSLTRFTELMVGEKVEGLVFQAHRVLSIPQVRVKMGINPDEAGLDDIEGFQEQAIVELSIGQKRRLSVDGLADLTDEQVAGLDNLTFDQLSSRLKRALFAYQLEQTIARSRDEVLKAQAEERNIRYAHQTVDAVWAGDFVHGTSIDALSSILQDGNVPGEARRSASKADSYPYNVDLGVVNGEDTIEARLRSTLSFMGGYGKGGQNGTDGQILLIYKRNSDSWMEGQETYPKEKQALIFGGIPSTEISGVALSNPLVSLESARRTVVENGFYIPIYDIQGKLLFSPEEYRSMRDDLNMEGTVIPPENIVDSSLKAEDQKGVSQGGLYLFPSAQGPVKYYVKFSDDNPDHIWTECLADELRREVGVAVPDTKIVSVEGRLGRASRWLEEGYELPDAEFTTLEGGAAMDMLLADWDVVYNPANTIVVNGVVLRPDAGSALDIWATGLPKREDTWGETVTELQTGADRGRLWEGMRQAYPDLTDERLRQQVERIQERLTDEVIDARVDSIRRSQRARDELKRVLKARRDDMIVKVLHASTG